MSNEKISGFSLVATARYEGFDEQILTELERIVQATYKLPAIQSAIQFHKDLEEHLHNINNPHHLTISTFFDQLISQLFRVYREWGGHGTKQEMLLGIYKDIPRGTVQDHLDGYRKDLAATTEGWHAIWRNHDRSRASHEFIKKIFDISNAPDVTPSIYISTMFPRGYYPFQDNPFDLTPWKSKSGTLVYDFGYSHPTEEHTHGQILELCFQEGSILVEYEYQDGLTILNYQKKNREGITIDAFLTKQFFGPDSCNRAVLTFDCDICSVLEYGSSHSFAFDYHELTPTVLDLKCPISRQGVGLREVSYYPKAFTPNQQQYFLQ